MAILILDNTKRSPPTPKLTAMKPTLAELNPNKTQTIRELGKVDIVQVKQLIKKLGEKVWEVETAGRENEFDCFHHTQHIVFRFPDTSKERMTVHDNPSWQIWKPYLLPVIEQAVKPYQYPNGELKAVMLAKLKAGYSIDMHVDGAPQYYFLHKIHIPIQTNDHVNFHIKPNDYQLKEGVAYEVNNLLPHFVANPSDEDRIHLIFEYHNAGS